MKIKHLRFKTYAILTVIALFLVTVAFIINHKSNVLRESESYYQAENDYLSALRMNTKTGKLSATDYAKALKEVQRYRENHNSNRGTLNWTNSGPDNFAGRVRVLLKDKNSEWIYLGSPNGGLWRIKEGSAVWTPLDGVAKNLNVSCMHQSANGTIYVGTGEGYYSEEFNMLPGFKGRGIYYSTDGENFNLIPSTLPSDNAVTGDEWYYVNKISSTDNYLFAATNTGLKYANLNGDEWSLASCNGVPLTGDCNELIINGNDIAIFVDGLAYISTTGDPHQFTCISTQTADNNPNMLPQDSIGRVSFAFAPTNPNYLYAMAINEYDNPKTKNIDERGTLNGVYRCVKNNGAWDNWVLIGPGNSFNMFYVFESNGLYSNAITVDPANENTIYIGGMDLWIGKDNGTNNIFQWTQLTTYENIFSKAYAPQNHFSYYKYNNNILIACENGVYKYNFTESKSSSYNINLNISQFYTVSANYKNDIFGGSQGIGTIKIDKEASLTSKSGINLHNHISTTTGNDFTSNKIGGYVHNSMINPIGTFVSINGRNDLKDENTHTFADFKGIQSLVLYRFDDQVPQNISYWRKGKDLIKPIEDSASYITPSILWESFDYDFSLDSVTFFADRDYAAGETITANSKNARYPIPYVLETALAQGDSVRVHDKIASRFFIGVNGSIFMTKEASNFNANFNENTPWYTISSSKVGGVTGTPQCMGLSKDANYLYVGTTDGNLYRISNIAYATDKKTANVADNLYKNIDFTLNPYCVISTTKIKSFENRIITSVSVNPTNPEMVVVTLGNYGYNDYIYISYNALDEQPTFTKVNSFANAPIFTSIFVEGTDISDNVFMVGCDFGIWKTNDISLDNPEWQEEVDNLAEVPIFMIKQQNVQTKDGNPIYLSDTIDYIRNYHGIYAASFGRGLYECLDFVKAGNSNVGIAENSSIDNNIVIYPNPAQSNATIEVETDSQDPIIINIYDITGKLVYTMQSNALNGHAIFNVNTSNFASGTYVVRIIADRKQQSSKLIVR